MQAENVAIVGLEHQGELFLEWLIGLGKEGPNIVCAVAKQNGVGSHRADARGIALVDLATLVQLSSGIDIIFDLTNDAELCDDLHQSLIEQGNHHTQLMSGKTKEVIATLKGERFNEAAA